MVKNNQEKTAADKTSIGFEYQHYYFIYRLLILKTDESIGYEVKDDVHIQNEDGTSELIQVKHTLKQRADGNPINLTELDTDLWKTLSNWITVLSEQSNPEEFISKTTFILATNKSSNKTNKFLSNLRKYKETNLTIDEFYNYIEQLLSKTGNENIVNYIRNVISLDRNVLGIFFKKVDFKLSIENIIEMINCEIKNNFIYEQRIQDVLNCIEGNIRLWKYDVVKNKNKIVISKSDVNKQLATCFENNKRKILPQRDFDTSYQDIENLNELPFIKELIQVEDIEEDDYAEMAKYNTQLLTLTNNMSQWVIEGELTEIDRKKFIDESISKWHNIHKSSHRKNRKLRNVQLTEEMRNKLIDSAHNCLDEVRKIDLHLDETRLTTDMSNGHYYNLSNKAEIGWQMKWEEKYK